MSAHNRPGALRRQVPELVVGLCLIAAPFVLPGLGIDADLLTRILIWGLFGLGFDLLFGYTGLLSFGQAAFYGTGGHSRVAADIITRLGERQKPVLINTDVYKERAYRMLLNDANNNSGLGERACLRLSAETNVEKAIELYMMLTAIRPSRITIRRSGTVTASSTSEVTMSVAQPPSATPASSR